MSLWCEMLNGIMRRTWYVFHCKDKQDCSCKRQHDSESEFGNQISLTSWLMTIDSCWMTCHCFVVAIQRQATRQVSYASIFMDQITFECMRVFHSCGVWHCRRIFLRFFHEFFRDFFRLVEFNWVRDIANKVFMASSKQNRLEQRWNVVVKFSFRSCSMKLRR